MPEEFHSAQEQAKEAVNITKERIKERGGRREDEVLENLCSSVSELQQRLEDALDFSEENMEEEDWKYVFENLPADIKKIFGIQDEKQMIEVLFSYDSFKDTAEEIKKSLAWDEFTNDISLGNMESMFLIPPKGETWELQVHGNNEEEIFCARWEGGKPGKWGYWSENLENVGVIKMVQKGEKNKEVQIYPEINEHAPPNGNEKVAKVLEELDIPWEELQDIIHAENSNTLFGHLNIGSADTDSTAQQLMHDIQDILQQLYIQGLDPQMEAEEVFPGDEGKIEFYKGIIEKQQRGENLDPYEESVFKMAEKFRGKQNLPDIVSKYLYVDEQIRRKRGVNNTGDVPPELYAKAHVIQYFPDDWQTNPLAQVYIQKYKKDSSDPELLYYKKYGNNVNKWYAQENIQMHLDNPDYYSSDPVLAARNHTLEKFRENSNGDEAQKYQNFTLRERLANDIKYIDMSPPSDINGYTQGLSDMSQYLDDEEKASLLSGVDLSSPDSMAQAYHNARQKVEEKYPPLNADETIENGLLRNFPNNPQARNSFQGLYERYKNGELTREGIGSMYNEITPNSSN
jgi:hypothetical protein